MPEPTVPTEANADRLNLQDHTKLPRYGCKGPGAAAWLAAHGLEIPPAPNEWAACGDGLVARLGLTEFLIDGDAELIARLSAAQRSAGVYPVLHQSLCVDLSGTQLDLLMRQVCSIDFKALDAADQPVVLTTMVGVSVTVLPAFDASGGALRLWADGSFGHYLWHMLAGLCAELGGTCSAPPAYFDSGSTS